MQLTFRAGTRRWVDHNVLIRPALPLIAAGFLALFLLILPAQRALAAPAGQEAADPTPALIDQAYAAGEINADQRLLYLAYAIYAPDLLPPAYQSSAPWYGSDVVAELNGALAEIETGGAQVTAAVADELSGLLRTDAATVCDNEDGANNFDSANFRINYDTIGGGLTIQDYAASLEKTYILEVNEYGWAAPPYCTAGMGACSATNPWNRYPVQVADLGGGLYGYVTAPGGNYAGFMGDNPNTPAVETAALASCMVLNRDYTGFPGGAQFSLDVTAAHEFAHSIQFGYGDPAGQEDGMWYESTAAYAEDEVLDAANDNYQYLWPEFERCLGDYPSSSIAVYSNWLFFRYAAERNGGTNIADGGEDLFAGFWANVAQGQGALTAYDNALATKGSNLDDTYHAYAIAGGFMQPCSSPPDASAPYCYEEATGYLAAQGAPPIQGRIDSVGGNFSAALENHYALNWIELPTSGPYAVQVENSSAGGELRVSIVAQTPDGLEVTPLPATIGGNATGELAAYTPPAGTTRVLAVITNQEMTSPNPNSCTPSAYTLQIDAPAGIAVAVDAPTAAPVAPGESVVHTFTLRNVGAEDAAFALRATSSLGWADVSSVPISVTLPSGGVGAVDIPVTVPADAPSGAVETTTITATSVENEAITASAQVQTTARPAQTAAAFLPIALREGAPSACVPESGDADNVTDALLICNNQPTTGVVSQTDRDDVYRFSATAGSVLEIELSGSGGNADLYLYRPGATDVDSELWAVAAAGDDSSERIRFYVPESGDWYVDVFAAAGSSDYTLRVTERPNDGFYSCTPDAAGESSNIDDARCICSGQTTSGAVSQEDIHDVYRINIPAGWYLTVHLTGEGGDTDLALFGPDADNVEEDEPAAVSDAAGSNEGLFGTLALPGDWYVDVYSFAGATDYAFTVYLAEIGSATTQGNAGLKDRNLQVDTAAPKERP